MPFIDWIKAHEVLLAWMGGLSLLTFIGSLIAMPVIIALMPADYFIRIGREDFPRRPFRQVLHVFKNLVGSVLLIAGVAMLVLPGQGLLTIVIGLSLIDFPGKHRLQIRLIRIQSVRKSIAWIRSKADRPELKLP